MKLIRGINNLPSVFATQGCALTIGNFDGVHLGHQEVLAHLKKEAKARHLPSVVMVFESQPSEYFLGDKAPARLMRLRDKIAAFKEVGVDYVFCVKFNCEFSQLTAKDFIQKYLVEKLNVKFLSVGDDFRFGLKRQGDFHLLQQAGFQYGFVVENNPTFLSGDKRISSTAIRQALAQDNLDLAQHLLGRPYRIEGRVSHGNKLGRTIGFPTANILLQRQVNPVKGVYAVKVFLPNGEMFYGVANIGTRPTINSVLQVLEVHLFHFKGDLYGKRLRVEFCLKIRNEQKFPNFEALQAQIKLDAKVAQEFFHITSR